jgi:hypothetical protein
MKKIVSSILIASLVSGCATSSKNIASSYVSPVQYRNYDCNQISEEAIRLQGQITKLGGRLDEASKNDKMITGVGIIVFWPALFALGGTKEQEAQYASLKGQYEALQQESIAKKCGNL